MNPNLIVIQKFEYFYHKYLRFIHSLDASISRNLADSGVKTRAPINGSNGLWCFAILPTILILNTKLYEVSDLYKLVACISGSLLCYSIIFTILMSISCTVFRGSLHGGCCGFISTLLIYFMLSKGLIYSVLFPLPSLYLYSILLHVLITEMPMTFTIGEATIVSQSISLFVAFALANILQGGEELDLVNITVVMVLLAVVIIVTALNMLKKENKTRFELIRIVAQGAVVLLIALHIALGYNCIFEIIYFVFMNSTRINLFCFWLSLSVAAVYVILVRTKMGSKATTASRKSFHLLAALVFMSGILVDVELMKLAAGIAFGVLLFVEALRKSGIGPVSSALELAFKVYSDEKDCGIIALTPIYLFTGLACPLLLVPQHLTLALLSGVLSVGVGDTAASWFGSRYGRHKWQDSKRTIEGTAANIVSQVMLVYLLQAFNLLNANNAVLRTIIVATVTSLVEAKTDQIDNLILPLVTIIGFQLTDVLS